MKKGKIEISKALIKKGLLVGEIADITGLSIEEVERLAASEE